MGLLGVGAVYLLKCIIDIVTFQFHPRMLFITACAATLHLHLHVDSTFCFACTSPFITHSLLFVCFLAVFWVPQFQQLNLTKCSCSSQSASSMASLHILLFKLLFAQPSMQPAQTQMEADAMDDWFSRHEEEGKTKWGSDCWQEKYNNPTVSETTGYLKATLF